MSGGAEQTVLEEQRAFLSGVFHDLSQPLTALQCSLELSLMQDRTPQELRGSIEASLAYAHSLRLRLSQARELSDADEPGNLSQSVDLGQTLRELQEEMLPLFETAGVRWEMAVAKDCPPIRGNREKLSRALFRFLEYLLRNSPSGEILYVHIFRRDGECVALDVSTKLNSGYSLPLDDAFEVDLVRRTLRAIDGGLARLPDSANRSLWRATLTVA